MAGSAVLQTTVLDAQHTFFVHALHSLSRELPSNVGLLRANADLPCCGLLLLLLLLFGGVCRG
jgi:hypothetical protein